MINPGGPYDACGSTGVGGDIISYQWYSGDGTRGSGKTYVHTYSLIGEYTVNLTIIDSMNNVGYANTKY